MALEDLYREVILDHYRAPRNRGELETPPAIKSEGKNPVCGDELTLYMDIEDGIVKDIKMSGSGCSISMASSSMMTAAVKGKTVEFVSDLITKFKALMDIHEENLEDKEQSASELKVGDESLGELDALTGVVKFPVRIKCATLAFNTLGNGVKMATEKAEPTVTTTE